MSPQSRPMSPFPPASPIFGIGLAAIIVLYFGVSHLMLANLGFGYEESGGNVLEKVHPATLVAVILFALAGLFRRNPIGDFGHALMQMPATLMYLVLVAILIVHAIGVVGLPFTGFLDTFVAPVFAFALFRDLGEQRAHRLALLLHAIVVINALVGIFEYGTGWRLTPLVANGVEITDDWRSTALFGHPLLNASLTGAYILAVAAGAGRDLSSVMRYAALAITSAAMIVFGGRAATILLLLTVLAIAAIRILDVLRGGRISIMGMVRALAVIPLVAIIMVALAEYGYFDLFLQRFMDDRGSAETRIDMFSLFNHLSWDALIFGPNPDLITSLQRLYGLDFGIESFWISFIMKSGLLLSIPFFIALFGFCRDVLKSTRREAVWVFLFFFAVASASVSLSAKTPLFTMVVIMLLVLFRRPVGSAHAVTRTSAPSRPRRRVPAYG